MNDADKVVELSRELSRVNSEHRAEMYQAYAQVKGVSGRLLSLQQDFDVVVKERDEARATVAGMRETVLLFENCPPVGEFTSFFNGQVYATRPDRVSGYFHALDAAWKSPSVKMWSEQFREARNRSYQEEAKRHALEHKFEAKFAALREELRPDWKPGEDTDDLTCKRCGEYYTLKDGCIPTPECDSCAHTMLEYARVTLSDDSGQALLARVDAMKLFVSAYDRWMKTKSLDSHEFRQLAAARAAIDDTETNT